MKLLRDCHLSYLESYFTAQLAAENKENEILGHVLRPSEACANLQDDDNDSLAYISLQVQMSQHLKMNALYWMSLSLYLLDKERLSLKGPSVSLFLMSCYRPCGGYAPYDHAESSLLSTLSAVQLHLLYDIPMSIEKQNAVLQYVMSLQCSDGSFMGDEYGEIDTRYCYAAVAIIALLERRTAANTTICDDFSNGHKHSFKLSLDKLKKTYDYLRQCRNRDGAYALGIDGESHGGQVFCCVAALDLLKNLFQDDLEFKDRNPDNTDHDGMLIAWLVERQNRRDGGLNGRPEKLSDVCYSWWILSALSIKSSIGYLNAESLINFILRAQNGGGGIADREGDLPDVFHTMFGLAGLSMLQYKEEGQDELLEAIDARFCLPLSIL